MQFTGLFLKYVSSKSSLKLYKVEYRVQYILVGNKLRHRKLLIKIITIIIVLYFVDICIIKLFQSQYIIHEERQLLHHANYRLPFTFGNPKF